MAAAALGSGPRQPDTLVLLERFLQKRDGIDKVLKIIRYTTKLLSATALAGSDSDLSKRLSEFEKSIGTSRKAYRLGKFLGDVNALRRTPVATPQGVLELVANSGEGFYYFCEQIVWLTKAGLLPPRVAGRLSKASAWAEATGYCAGIALNCWRLFALLEREAGLAAELARRCRAGGGDAEADKLLASEVSMLRSRRTERTLKVVQDCADLLLAVNDLRDGNGRQNHPVVLCTAGLMSALISAHKNWRSVAAAR